MSKMSKTDNAIELLNEVLGLLGNPTKGNVTHLLDRYVPHLTDKDGNVRIMAHHVDAARADELVKRIKDFKKEIQ
jgi:hypothetical protein